MTNMCVAIRSVDPLWTRGCLSGDIADNAVFRVLVFKLHASLKHAMSSRLCLYSCMLQTQAVECLKEDRHDMLRRSCLALLSVMAFAPLANSASISVASGLGANNVEHSDHTLHLQPPENTAHDIEASLAAIVEAEHAKRQLSDSEFEAAKQRMINVEKQRIHDIVRNAFEALA